MMEKNLLNRLLSLMLVAAILCGFVIPVHAAEETATVSFQQVDNSAVTATLPGHEPVTSPEEDTYASTDVVRVSIVLEKESTVAAGFAMEDIAQNVSAMAYRQELQTQQQKVTASIEKSLDQKLDVAWNLTLAANLISADVEYGQIEAIEKVPGVEKVLIETRYEPAVVDREETNDPNMATSSKQTGSGMAWASGYTGAGARIAVIDTGIDTAHQSFTNEGYQYSLAYHAGESGLTLEEYVEKLNLLDVEEVTSVAEQLNVKVDPAQSFVSQKIPFAYNYVDKSYYVTHKEDKQTEHGSHVSGIAAANAYIPKEDGTFSKALDSVKVQGVAPDAQIITMKVFGKSGGAYDSDYMAAIEDAIVLGCDSVNLSLGSGSAGGSRHATAEYQEIMENLTNAGIVVCMSAGNNGGWVDHAKNLGRLYADDVNMHTAGSPGTYTNSLSVASVNNDGATGLFIGVKDVLAVYSESDYKNQPMATLAGEQQYILIDGHGTVDDWAAVGEALKGKVAMCSRGDIAFSLKGDNAVDAGAIATVVYNNQPGIINMDLTDYKKTAPCVSITQAAGQAFRENAEAVTDESGKVLYYTGTMTISDGVGSSQFDSEFYTMSEFSSWGVAGSLELKPEITAPGGSIYSVFGETPHGGGSDKYETMSGTSMAAPQVSGMAALVAQYIRENNLAEKTGMTPRHLAQSLLMSTAVPMLDGESGSYYPILQQGAGLGNVGAAVNADSYITMDENATKSFADGKVKVELGDDPQRTGVYNFSFNINNLEDTDKAFALSADFFTQKLFEYYANGYELEDQTAYYMDTRTVSAPVNVTWEVDGKVLEPSDLVRGLDFDGNGSVNAADGQALLDYAVDNTKTIQNLDKADIDKDGDVDTQDAYLFFKNLGTGTIVVPADGSKKVNVKVELTDAWQEYLKTATNGVYVEGYIFAESMASEEGVEGTIHSIPVLGFFGNWSDPSMYDVGTRAQYVTHEDIRMPYLGDIEVNTYLVTYANDPKNVYALGGNPLIPDEKYKPERNAINSENGDAVSKVQFAAIRNAAASRFTAKNVTTGEELAEALPGAVGAAYFYPASGRWMNDGYTLKANFVPKGAAEGDQLLLNLALAPEYYADSEGNISWDTLGKGANFSLPLVVDNTAPVLEDVSLSFTGNTLNVKASDNQYIAAVALFNKSGTKAHAAAGSIMDIKPGESGEYVLDLTNVNGKKFALQVMDYAMNTTTYMIEMEIGEQQPLPEMIAFTLESKYWFAFDKDTKYDSDTHKGLEPYSPTNKLFTAATIADHVVLAATQEGELYAMPEDDLAEENLIGNVGMLISDMAYNKADGEAYAVSDNKLYTINKLTGDPTEVGTIGVLTNTLACDKEGTFYCNKYGTSEVYKFTLDTMDAPVLLGAADSKITSKYIQAMEINPNTDMLCWNSYYTKMEEFFGMTFEIGFSNYVEMNTKTGEAVAYNDLWEEISSLIIPERTSGGSWAAPTDKISGVRLSHNDLSVLKGTTRQLSAVVQPWTATDRTVTWTSEDESIATVDEKGVVTGVGVGTTTVTAASTLDPTVTAKCTVTVETLDITAKGLLQDKDGNPQFFTWNMEEADTWTPGTAVDTNMVSATFDTSKKFYYVQEDSEGLLMHKVGEDGVTAATSETNGAGVPLWDMAYSSYFSTEETPLVSSIYAYYFLSPKDPMNLDGKAFDLQSRCEYLTAITSLGYEQYPDNETGELLDTEHIVLLAKDGTVFHFWVYQSGDSMSAWLNSYPSNLELPFAGYNNLDKMYCSLVPGDNGTLYLSYFTGEANELYRLAFDAANEEYTADLVGNFGDGVWPVILTEVTNNTESGTNFVPVATEKMEAVVVTEADMQAAAEAMENNTANEIFEFTKEAKDAKAEIQSTSQVEEGEKNVTVTITAKDAAGADVASTNALMSASYDTSKLELVDVAVYGDYTSKILADGKVTFGYVSLDEIPAGNAVATLKFKVLAAEESNVTVETLQVNNDKGGKEELKIEFTHENTEVRDAVEATCTKPGYTGDTYCLDCGRLIAKGEVVPAKGHQWSEWEVTKEATCTEKGEESRTCSVCGETETREVDAHGHKTTDNVVAPTCTADGYTEHVCDVCGESWRDTIVPATGHKTELRNVKEATCTEPGYTGDEVCTVCGEIVKKGEEIPAAGHTWGEWKVTKEATCFADGEKVRTCTVCGETETEVISANTDHCPCKVFEDLDCTKWYHEGVDFVLERGIMKGVADKQFKPNGKVTRAQMVTMLYRMAGSPEVKSENPFTDVKAGKWYTDAILWAAESGITDGVTKTLFAPEEFVTREQMVTFLYRYAKLNGKDVSAAADLSEFADAGNVHTFAKESMAWAVAEGLVEGADGRLYPVNTTTRAQAATVLMRYCK